MARRLSGQGHRVVLTARSADQLAAVAASLPGPTMSIAADVTESSDVAELFASVEQAWGPVEVLVLNAGGATSAPLTATTDDDWQHMLDLCLTAPFRMMRRAVPAMTDRGWGRIVAIASTAAKRGEPYISAYTASKHGLLGLVRSAASELAATGVTVNAVCPGYVDTPMTEQTVAGISRATGRSTKQARDSLASRQPIGRLITVDEVADAVLMCVHNAAVNGQGLNVDGGAVQS